MYQRLLSHRKTILTSLLLILLGVWLVSDLSPRTSQAVSSSGAIYVAGQNQYGQLGDGSTNDNYIPEQINLPNGVMATNVSAGLYFSLAIGNDGKLYGWGYGGDGELGNGR